MNKLNFIIFTFLILSSLTLKAFETCDFSDYSNIPISTEDCKEYYHFSKVYKNGTIYLGFASPFIKNPASLFGHNFVLVTKENQPPLTGFTFSFEAISENTSGISYLYNGLTGGFTGHYFIRPFYSTIRLYNNFEDRNLYLFPLKLKPDERNKYLKKMWYYSRYKTYPYYFFTKNCAFYLYEFLEDASSPILYFSPQETIRKLSNKIDYDNLSILPSIKSEIKNISSIATKPQTKVVIAYKNAKFEIYKKYRDIENRYQDALLELNQASLESKEKIPDYKLPFSDLIFSPYTLVEWGHNFKKKHHFKVSGIENNYKELNAISKLEALSFSYNNYTKKEYDINLFNIDSKSKFEWYFKDISWKVQAKYLKNNGEMINSTELQAGAGLTFAIIDNLLFTVRGMTLFNHINDSSRIRLFPNIELDYNYKRLEMNITYTKMLLRNNYKASITYFIKPFIKTFIDYETTDGYRTDISNGLSYLF